jgi:hypothetical protein
VRHKDGRHGSLRPYPELEAQGGLYKFPGLHGEPASAKGPLSRLSPYQPVPVVEIMPACFARRMRRLAMDMNELATGKQCAVAVMMIHNGHHSAAQIREPSSEWAAFSCCGGAGGGIQCVASSTSMKSRRLLS